MLKVVHGKLQAHLIIIQMKGQVLQIQFPQLMLVKQF